VTRPTFLSLFSGIGGLDLGLERAGWGCVGQVEIDPFCQRVLARHWPDVPRWGDIREVDPDDLPRADLIAGGFPCQPVSSAGKRLAQDDPRWLWPQAARLVRHLRPRWLLLENVSGLLVRGMGDVLDELAASGYDAEWDCIPASAVGAPHRRDRVWIVAYPDSGARPGRWQPRALEDTDSLAVGQGRRGRRAPEAGELAHADSQRQLQPPRLFAYQRGWAGDGGWWAAEPDVGRVAHGVPARLDRLRALGNAVVPQVAELIGRRILAVHKEGAPGH
jgi:DNA (cytosine-5)-methyltransferase 1